MTDPNPLSYNSTDNSEPTDDNRFNGHATTAEAPVNDNANVETTDVETNEATLRQMTGAPDINQPLVNKDAFADIDISSSRPVWKLPGPKLALIAAALVPVFGLAGYFLAGGQAPQQQANIPTNPEADADSQEADEGEEITELQQAEQEIAALKSQIALDDQAYIQDSQRPTTSTTSTGNQPDESVETSPTSTISTPEPQTVSVAPRSMPPSVNYNPPSPPIQSSASRFNNSSGTEPLSDRFVEVDPFEQWRQLAQVGSYGNIAGRDLANQTETDTAVANASNTLSQESVEVASAIPTAYFAATSATVPTYSAIDFREERSVEQQPDGTGIDISGGQGNRQTTSRSSLPEEEPEILAEAESQILEGQVLSSTNITQSLIAGGYAAGELVTPVVLDNEGVEDRFMVVLSEPLMDNEARIAIPAGALLVVQVDRVSENGLVQLSATQAIWEEQGFQRELVLPSQTLLVRGNDGDPLIAENYGDIGGDIAAMDMGQFALGAIRRVGELYTRSDSRVQTGDGTTVITESNPEPNILAGALEGGSDAILDAISERNQQAIERLQERPRIPYISSGTAVQIFI
ncbi:MAG: hypothetical protein AAFN38_21020, partial [Cyanobacteria bacterium J06560_5]